MPSGYTATLYEGKSQTFEQFALEDARGMGAAIMQRDDAPGPIADEYEPSTYYRDALEDAEMKLADLRTFTAEEWRTRERAVRERDNMQVKEAIEIGSLRRARYETMLAQIEAWRPPTSDHENFKTFMLEQIKSSIDFDCSTSYLKPRPVIPWQEYKVTELASAEKDVERCREGWREEQERTAGRNKWVRDLRESLRGLADDTQ